MRPAAGNTTAAVAPHHHLLLGILRDLTRTMLLDPTCTCRLLFSVGCGTRQVRASVQSVSHRSQSVLGIRGSFPSLKTPRVFHAVPTSPLATCPLDSPRHHKSQRSRPQYLLWALGGYFLLALCCLLLWRFKTDPPSPAAKNDGKDPPLWVLDLDVVDIHALRDANPEYDFFALSL